MPADELGSAIATRLEEIARTRDYTKAAKVHAHLYGEAFGIGDGSDVGRKGEDGQLLDVNIKRAKALLKSLVGLVLGPPKTWRCSARNADAESRGSVLLGANLCEFFWKEDGFDVFCDEWVEAGYAFDESYVWARWSSTQGEAVGVNPLGQLVLAGGLRATQHQKWDVFFDAEYRSFEELPWLCLRTFESKWDLAATARAANEEELQRLREQIVHAGTEFLKDSLHTLTPQAERRDVVPVYRFFHRPTPSVPQGICVTFLDAQTVLSIEACEEIPVRRFAPGTRIDSPFGDSQWSSTLGIEDLLDMVESAVASNFEAFAAQAVEMPGEMKISIDKLTNLTVFERGKMDQPGQVTPIQLVRQPQGAPEWASSKVGDMAFVTGQNDVQLGQPDTAQMNAKAFAILKSAATERNSLGQRRALRAIGELGALVLRILSKNITEEQALAIGGRAARLSYPARKWTGSDLESITNVFVEVGNPLEQHPAGRLEILTALREAGVPMSAEDVQQVVETGRMEQAIAPAREESLLIAWENDEILDGRTPVVHWAHNHLNHYPKHACLASQPAVLRDEAAVTQLEQHLAWHYREFWGLTEGVNPKTDPMYFDRIRIMLGQQAPGAVGPPPPGMPAEPPAGGAPTPKGDNPPPNGAPPALSPPTEGEQQLPSVVPPAAA